MIGSVIGDVVGSRFEFNNIKTKEFELFTKDDSFTDDSVLTMATAEWLLHGGEVKNYYADWAIPMRVTVVISWPGYNV